MREMTSAVSLTPLLDLFFVRTSGLDLDFLIASSIQYSGACCACRHKLLLHIFVNAPALPCFLPAMSTLF